MQDSLGTTPRLHPWPVRIVHWINAVAMIVMIGSGWGIYDDSVIINGLWFPHAIRIGGWAADLVVIAAGVMQVVTGVAVWKPVQFGWLTALFGGFQGARIAHFIGMAVIVGFVVVHVALAFLVPRTLVAMVTGGPRLAAPAE